MSANGQAKRNLLCGLVGASLTVLATWAVLASPFGNKLRHLSYDLALQLRPDLDVENDDVVIVYMDDDSHEELNQPSAEAWNRGLHADLIKRLTSAQVRVIAFDVFFRGASTNNSTADLELLTAAQAHSKVLFAAVLAREKDSHLKDSSQRILYPFQGLGLEHQFPCLTNLSCVGLAEAGPDYNIRRHHPGNRQVETLAWKCAQWTMADPPRDPLIIRWRNYYRATNAIPHLSFYDVWKGDPSALRTLSNKVVFVGARATRGPTGGSGTDWMHTPYGSPVPGVDIIATTYLNLLRDDWLRGLSGSTESMALTLLAIFIGYRLAKIPPRRAVILGLCGAAALFTLNYLLLWKAYWWFDWILPCTVQIPCALLCSVLTQTWSMPKESAKASPAPEAVASTSSAAELTTAKATPAIPDHTLLRRIGRGAYGEVWLARNVVGLYRAVKIVHRHAFEEATPYEREFRGLQYYLPISLNHPGLLRVLHVGRNDAEGYFFSIMEAADDKNETPGQPLNTETYHPRDLAGEITHKGRIPASECVGIFVALTEALHYLHQQQLVHRDIKPSNIIFVGGAPKLADIGLVTSVATPGHAVSNLGTQGYVAPEGPGTPAADVFSVGKVLYEACMGRDREMFPEFPTTWLERPDHPLLADLNKILGKACMTDTALRYSSAAEMHTELVRLQPRSAGANSVAPRSGSTTPETG